METHLDAHNAIRPSDQYMGGVARVVHPTTILRCSSRIPQLSEPRAQRPGPTTTLVSIHRSQELIKPNCRRWPQATSTLQRLRCGELARTAPSAYVAARWSGLSPASETQLRAAPPPYAFGTGVLFAQHWLSYHCYYILLETSSL